MSHRRVLVPPPCPPALGAACHTCNAMPAGSSASGRDGTGLSWEPVGRLLVGLLAICECAGAADGLRRVQWPHRPGRVRPQDSEAHMFKVWYIVLRLLVIVVSIVRDRTMLVWHEGVASSPHWFGTGDAAWCHALLPPRPRPSSRRR